MKACLYFLVLGRLLTVCLAGQAGNSPSETLAWETLAEQVDAQAAEIRLLKTQVATSHGKIGSTSPIVPLSCDAPCDHEPPSPPRVPVVADACPQQQDCTADDNAGVHVIRYTVDYDHGLTFQSLCPEKHPFKLTLNAWMQMRHHALDRDVTTWTDNAGVTRPVQSRNAFDIERARLVLSGHAWDPRLEYFIQLDGDTDGGHVVDFFDHWWGWRFHDNLLVQLGKRKVPASRQWLLGARRTRLVDRPMATDFFRPDRTVGLFAVGTVGQHGHWEAMVGNGYRTANLTPAETDNQLTFAATNYYEPLGPFGGNPVDFSGTCEPLVRIGHSLVYSPQTSDGAGSPLPEARFLRLTDGTVLTQTGALAAGVTVTDFDIYYYSVDFAAKWRGWSVDAEAYLRWLEQIQGNGPVPVTDLFQRGFYIEGGTFLIPGRLDANLRYSQVSGLFGNASEVAAGVNWYPQATQRLKVSFDVTSLDGSPLNNTTSDILAGDDGVLFRTQMQAEF